MSKKYTSYVCLDLETTGLEPGYDDIIEVAAIKVKNAVVVEQFDSLVYTPAELSDIVIHLTGITSKDLEKAKEWSQIRNDVEEFIEGLPLVGHNIGFDAAFLKAKGVKFSSPLWDTYIMSTLLYPELPSHSLETNSLYFNIAHVDSHRAMSDVLASHELWNILINTFPKVSPEQRARIESIAMKSSWELMPFFLQDLKPHTFSYKLLSGDVPERKPLEIPGQRAKQELLYCKGRNPLECVKLGEQQKKKLIIAAYPHTRHDLHRLYPQAVHFSGPESTYSLAKVEQLLSKEKLSDEETHLLLRLTLYPDITDVSDLSLSHGERFVSWKQVQASEEDMLTESNGPAHAKYGQALSANDLITSQRFLLSHPAIAAHFDNIVVLEPDILEENADASFTRDLSWESWQECGDASEEWMSLGKRVFAAITDILKQLVQESPYTEKVLYSKEISEAPTLKSLVRKISEITREPVDNSKKSDILSFLKHFFIETGDETVRWMSIHPKYGVSLFLSPLHLREVLMHKVFQEKPLAIVSNTLPKSDLFPDAVLRDLSQPLGIEVILPPAEELQGTKKEGPHAPLIRKIQKLCNELSGKTGIVFGSKSKLKQYFFQIYNPRQKHRADFFAEDVGAGSGKLLDNYRSSDNPNKVIFLSYRHLRAYRREHMDFDNIILQCLPFEPPLDPVQQKRAETLDDPFRDIALPNMQRNLLEIISNISQKEGRDRKVFILDPRAQNASYSAEVMRVLGS